ncbi:MAG: hypothetical protein AAF591_15930 [Verrucomicrobiota bacterium]
MLTMILIASAMGWGGLLTGCGSADREITVKQALGDRERRVKTGATSDERFRDRNLPTMAASDEESGGGGENPLRWATPEGWEVLDPTQMRVVNMRFGPEGEGECFLSVLPGAGGGVAGNLNRWAGQMGVDALSAEDLASLPKQTLFGREAPMVDFEGTYAGMGNIEPIEEARMLGTVLADEQMTFFVKMVGPKDLVDAERENFGRFCSSLRIVTE